jgi:hypothetical protein
VNRRITSAVAAATILLPVLAACNGTDDATTTKSAKVNTAPDKDDKASKSVAPKKEKKVPKVATFKVWGTAPAGALGGLNITYGSDSDSRKGTFKNGKFEGTVPVKKGALYYQVNAQLQGSGDINCSVTISGKTKKAHASGGYNMCMTQLSNTFFDGLR